ncbi:6-phosphogluconate dehydrogenase [Nonlabens ponticola]|uniref:6-phosphogluconate dehydrogenase n=1 Tax=Nonlabens ponticola TaxID=2496866 RepID=A0A3S9MZ75_9FLAO|nr:6-phosphogluconate dehydrogenase [Nonlabens ponticola]AZQ44555.1 6-phosphogluconate dehydrogenase [Nonlabens ponticola]
MKKILGVIIATIVLMAVIWYSFLYFATYSDGSRSGELIKFSHKGFLVKTWEGEISQGISGAQIFQFSVLDEEDEVIEKLQEFQGEYVKLEYEERFGTFFFWGDTKYFITGVELEESPHFRR